MKTRARQAIALSAIAAIGTFGGVSHTSAAVVRVTAAPAPIDWWAADGSTVDSVGTDNGTAHGVLYRNGAFGHGQSFFFPSKSYIEFNNTGGNLGTGDFTLTFFIRTSTQGQEAVWEKRPVCNAAHFWSIRTTATGGIGGEIYQPGVDLAPISTSAINDGRWHAVAIVRQGLTASIYIQGQVQDTVSSPTAIDVSNTVDMQAGKSVCEGHDGTKPFNGRLDEMKIYNVALTPAQVKSAASELPAG